MTIIRLSIVKNIHLRVPSHQRGTRVRCILQPMLFAFP